VNDRRADDKGTRVQIALAEFNALRGEIISHSTTQAGLIALAVTAIGLVGGFVIKEDGDPRLLLILPFLVSAAGIHSAEQGRGIALMGTYIRDSLWPYLDRIHGEDGLVGEAMPSWEQTVTDFRDRKKHKGRWTHPSFLLLSGLPGTLIFFFGSAVPLVVVNFLDDANLGGLFSWDVYRVVWWLGTALLAVHAVLAASALSLGNPLWETLEGYDSSGRRIVERSTPKPVIERIGMKPRITGHARPRISREGLADWASTLSWPWPSRARKARSRSGTEGSPEDEESPPQDSADRV
jgi:hypothetical protein